uniref:Vesicle transport protein USE1 n=1 Tax=Araucaria cunninghamii TaxID=56994 RepID=A0A0D6R823_ARACU
MGLSKTEINLRRLLAAAPEQENQANLIHYVATLREQLAELTGEGTRDGLPSISASKAKEYAEKIEALAAKIDSGNQLETSEPPRVSDDDHIEEVPEQEQKYTTNEESFASSSSTPVLRKRHIQNSKDQSKVADNQTTKSESRIKLDESAQAHIEKHRRLQEDLTDEMVGLAHQLKETSLMMNQSLLDTEKTLDSTERAVEHSLASTGRINERTGEIYSQSFKTSCFTWLMIFAMSCIFLMVILLIRIT